MARPRVLWFGPRLFGPEKWGSLDVVRAGPDEGSDIQLPWQALYFLDPIAKEVKPDLLAVEAAYGFRIADLHHLGIPKVYTVWDPQISWEYERYYVPLFDAVAVSQREYLRDAESSGAQAVWFPHYSSLTPEECDGRPPGGFRPTDVCFVGNVESPFRFDRSRHDFLQSVAGSLPKEVTHHFGRGDWKEIYSRSKIVLNHSLKGEINLRLFEGMSCGALVLNPATGASLGGALQSAVHFAEYKPGDADSAVESIRSWLARKEDLDRVAREGHAAVRHGHLLFHRMGQWSGWVNEWSARGPRPIDPGHGNIHTALSLLSVILLRAFPMEGDHLEAFEKIANVYLEAALAACEQIPSASPSFAAAQFITAMVQTLRGDVFASHAALESVYGHPDFERLAPVIGEWVDSGSGTAKATVPASEAGGLGYLVQMVSRIVHSGKGLIGFRLDQTRAAPIEAKSL
ncbi:MAG: glycosyltransferase [Nitrospirae bacterium]|nr:glycosyltransferase [Nitrospirota bacterium]